MFVGIIPVVVPLMTCYLWEGIAKSAGLVRFGISGFIKSLAELPTLLLMRLAFGAGFCAFGMFRALASNSLARLTEIISTKTSTGFGLSTESIVGNQKQSEVWIGAHDIIPDIVGCVSLR
jgi:hypothetical protein